METFALNREFVANPDFAEQKQACLAGLHDGLIDRPIVDVINGLNALECCFTLQCCYGHFVHPGCRSPHNLEPLWDHDTGPVEYRLAYVALCLADSPDGRGLHKALQGLSRLAIGYVQFGCAQWFWDKQVNTFVLQVAPERYKLCDSMVLSWLEARVVEEARNRFYKALQELVDAFPGAGSGE